MVKHIISLAHESLVNAAADLKYFHPTETSQFDNNSEARAAAMIEGPGDCWVISCEDVQSTGTTDQNVLHISHNDAFSDCSHLIAQNVKFSGHKTALLNVGPHTYLIPPDSSFLMSNLKHLQTFPHLTDGPFDLIVMDPPWQNKSVKRQKSYWSVTNEDFLSCPIEKLAAPGCIVVVWVTNRQSHQRFVKERLFPRWNVQFLARWHWLKVTTSGEFVYDLDSPHKKPYEALLLGRYKNKHGSTQGIKEQESVSDSKEDKIPQDKVIISIPCSLHSKKPYLGEIVSPYLISKPKCLELFARNLWTGWTSWGNEVLKHQHIDYFQLKETVDNEVTNLTETDPNKI